MREKLGPVRILPVVTLEDPGVALELAAALAEGGIRAIEVTLRTPRALECLRTLARAATPLWLGAGTVLRPADVDAAVDAGARFLVSPGLTPELTTAVQRHRETDAELVFLPGVATAGEAMRAADDGFDLLKLFPAQVVGGVRLLKALNGPLPHLSFCPTGGIRPEHVADYLSLPNVVCVGGSWMVPASALAARDFDRIRQLSADAMVLGRREATHEGTGHA